MTGVNMVMVMILGACVKPVDVKPFLEDETVQDFLESTKETVKVDNQTGDGLKGVKGKIEGLKNDKYYMVEKEHDRNGNSVDESSYPMYVTDYPGAGPGGLHGDLGLITRISGGSINNLTDFHTYTVRSAQPFADGDLTYTDGNGTVTKQITGGVVNIERISGTGTLDLSVLTGTYEVIAVSADGSLNSWTYDSRPISRWDSFELEGANTEIDYVFVKENTPSDFRVLRVKIGPSSHPGISFNLTFNAGDKTTMVNTGSDIAIGSLNETSTVTLTLNISGGTATSISWYYNGVPITPDPNPKTTLILKNNDANINYLIVGKHIFTAVADIGGVPYSDSFTITIKEK